MKWAEICYRSRMNCTRSKLHFLRVSAMSCSFSLFYSLLDSISINSGKVQLANSFRSCLTKASSPLWELYFYPVTA